MTTAIGAAGLYFPYFPAVAAVFAIVARAWISIHHRMRENNAPYYFTQQNNGMIILGIIPGSKAEKMRLSIGEVISKCNGEPVRNMDEFYRALQKARLIANWKSSIRTGRCALPRARFMKANIMNSAS